MKCTPGHSKIYEKCILYHMAIDLYKIYDKDQFGFLPNSSTSCSIVSLLHYIQCTIDSCGKKRNYILSLDLTKAFDNVNHDKLLSILSAYKLNPNFICLM